MDTFDRLALDANKCAELSCQKGEFFIRILECQPGRSPIYVTHEIPVTHDQMESLANSPFHSDILLNLPGLQVRYIKDRLAIMEEGSMLAWSSRRFMQDRARLFLLQANRSGSLTQN